MNENKTVIHPLPWKWKKSAIVDANGIPINSEVDAANAFAPHLLIPKLLKDHPQPTRDDKWYLFWFEDGKPDVTQNDHVWGNLLIAWAGPIEPLPQPDPFEEWYDYFTQGMNIYTPQQKEHFRRAFMAGKEAK